MKLKKNERYVIDGIDIFKYINDVEVEANKLTQRINKTIKLLKFYRGTDWGRKGIEILDLFEKSLKGVDEK